MDHFSFINFLMIDCGETPAELNQAYKWEKEMFKHRSHYYGMLTVMPVEPAPYDWGIHDWDNWED